MCKDNCEQESRGMLAKAGGTKWTKYRSECLRGNYKLSLPRQHSGHNVLGSSLDYFNVLLHNLSGHTEGAHGKSH